MCISYLCDIAHMFATKVNGNNLFVISNKGKIVYIRSLKVISHWKYGFKLMEYCCSYFFQNLFCRWYGEVHENMWFCSKEEHCDLRTT